MRKSLFVLGAAFAFALSLAGCGGDDGAAGPPGPTGATGPAGPAGPAGPPGTGTGGTAGSPDGDLSGTITAVTIDAANNQKVTVTFSLKDAGGVPVVGAEAKNFEFQVGKRVPASATKPAYWQSYINRSDQEDTGPSSSSAARACQAYRGSRFAGRVPVHVLHTARAAAAIQYYGSGVPESTACAAVVPNSGAITGAAWDSFKGTLNLAYDAAATTRLTIVGRDGARVNLVQDFVPSALPALPAAASAQIVTTASCGACHAESSAKRDKIIPGESGHFSRRYKVEVCVMCHNAAGFDPATSTAATWKTLDLKIMLHDLHAAEFPQGDSFGGVSNIRNPNANVAGLDTGLPAGARPRFDGATGRHQLPQLPRQPEPEGPAVPAD